MQDKKGVSAIIATVLIISISVVGVAVIRGGVLSMIQDSSGFESPEVQLKAVISQGYTVYDSDYALLLIQVKRGNDDEEIVKIDLIINFNGTSIIERVDALEVNSKRTYYLNVSAQRDLGLVPTSVKVAPIYSINGQYSIGVASGEVSIPHKKIKDVQEILDSKEVIVLGTNKGGGSGYSNERDDDIVIPICDPEVENCDDVIYPEPDFLEKARIGYTYGHSANESVIDRHIENGMNGVVIKGGYVTYDDYSDLDDCLPSFIKEYAEWSKEKDFMYFQGMNFVHRFPTEFSDNKAVFSDGSESNHTSPWDEKYWDHLTNLVVNLANLSAKDPDTYSMKGVWFDFELYNQEDRGEPRYINIEWGFADFLFQDYVTERGLTGELPTSSNERADRIGWLQTNNKEGDYYLYLEERMYNLADNMKNKVKAVDPDFYLGAYPSSAEGYVSDIYSGWSDENNPIIIWGTESYYGGGSSNLPEVLDDGKMPSRGYYNLTDMYDKEVYGYYFGGFVLRRYSPINLAYHLYNVAKESDGYWIFSMNSLTRARSELRDTYRVDCFNESRYTLYLCADQEEYSIVQAHYWNQINNANQEMDEYLDSDDYETSLELLEEPYIESQYGAPDFDIIDLIPLGGPDLETVTHNLNFRFESFFVFSAKANEGVMLNVSNVQVVNNPYFSSYGIFDEGKNVILEGDIELDQNKIISFVSGTDSNYVLSVNSGSNIHRINSFDVPFVAYVKEEIRLISTPGNFSFWVGDISSFNLTFGGSGTGEGVRAIVYRPDGDTLVGTTNGTSNEFSLNLLVGNFKNSLWKVEILRPLSVDHPGSSLEDYKISSDEIEYFGLTDDDDYFIILP